jgi:hypothetical protein
VSVSAGTVVAVPLELLASPLKGGRKLGDGDLSALVIGGTEKIHTGGGVAFLKVVAAAEAQVKRDGQVRAKGSPVHHARLGPLEGRLDAQAGPGAIGGIAGSAPLDARLVKGQRERLLARAFMLRVIVLMTLMPDARIGDVIIALAGDLALVPWARPWRPSPARPAGDWRRALGNFAVSLHPGAVGAGAHPGMPGSPRTPPAQGKRIWKSKTKTSTISSQAQPIPG